MRNRRPSQGKPRSRYYIVDCIRSEDRGRYCRVYDSRPIPHAKNPFHSSLGHYYYYCYYSFYPFRAVYFPSPFLRFRPSQSLTRMDDVPAFLVENPTGTEPDVVAAEDARGRSAQVSSAEALCSDLKLGQLHRTPEDPYAESDKIAAAERRALDLQFQGMTKMHGTVDGTCLREGDKKMEHVHETYASYNAAGHASVSLKDAIARHDAEVKARVERYAGGTPLLPTKWDKGMPDTEGDELLRRMQEADMATKRAVADNDAETLQNF
jgi:hypothetical protein